MQYISSEKPIHIGSIILWNIYKFSYVPIKISHQVPYLIIIHTNQFYSLRRKNIPYLSIFYLTSHFLPKSPEIYVTVNFFPTPSFFSIPCYYFFTLIFFFMNYLYYLGLCFFLHIVFHNTTLTKIIITTY